jgi:hypothetical protein
MARPTRAIEARRLKFTPALLANIRHRFEHTDESLSTMAADLGCCRTTLHGIAKRGGWVRYVRPPRDLASSARLEARAEALADDRHPEEAGEGRSDSLRHPEVRAQRTSKDERLKSTRPWPSPFEGRRSLPSGRPLAGPVGRPPQGDGESQLRVVPAPSEMADGLPPAADTAEQLYAAVVKELAEFKALRAQLKGRPLGLLERERAARTLAGLTALRDVDAPSPDLASLDRPLPARGER